MLLLLPTLQLARAALKHWYTWNCSPQYARITSSITRLFVAFAGTKHCCLTAINRCGALCCPDFPRNRGLKHMFFFPYPAIDRHTILCFSLFSKERHTGIEPASSAWEADALPMCSCRKFAAKVQKKIYIRKQNDFF